MPPTPNEFGVWAGEERRVEGEILPSPQHTPHRPFPLPKPVSAAACDDQGERFFPSHKPSAQRHVEQKRRTAQLHKALEGVACDTSFPMLSLITRNRSATVLTARSVLSKDAWLNARFFSQDKLTSFQCLCHNDQEPLTWCFHIIRGFERSSSVGLHDANIHFEPLASLYLSVFLSSMQSPFAALTHSSDPLAQRLCVSSCCSVSSSVGASGGRISVAGAGDKRSAVTESYVASSRWPLPVLGKQLASFGR